MGDDMTTLPWHQVQVTSGEAEDLVIKRMESTLEHLKAHKEARSKEFRMILLRHMRLLKPLIDSLYGDEGIDERFKITVEGKE